MTFDERLECCVVCAHQLTRFDDMESQNVVLFYDVCLWCGVVQMNPRPDQEELDRHYAQAYWAGTGTEDRTDTTEVQRNRARQQRELAGRTPRRHLDIGCSEGALLGEFEAGEQVGVEPGSEHRSSAEATGIEVYASIDALVATNPEPFDLITMSHVLEHLPDPAGQVRLLRTLLTPGGELLVEVPSLYRSLAYELAHLLAFDERSLSATLRASGLEVIRCRTHRGRQGSLGIGRNLAVVAVSARPRAPTDQHRQVRAMVVRRRLGFAPQQFYRWRNRTGRRLRRRLGNVLPN